MTNAETRDYSALESRELDALVAERVMGWQVTRDWPQGWAPDDCSPTAADIEDLDDLPSWFSERGPVYHSDFADHEVVPHYSTDPAAAFTVLEAMRARGWRYAMYPVAVGPETVVTFSRTGKGGSHIERHNIDASMPRAVCIAALRAIEAGA